MRGVRFTCTNDSTQLAITDSTMVDEIDSDLEILLDNPFLRHVLLTHFHPKRLEDIQGLISLWSLGLLRDDETRELFSKVYRFRQSEFLSPDMEETEQRNVIRNAMNLDMEALGDMSGEEMWSRYQFLSVIPKSTCRFVIEGLQYRNEIMRIISCGRDNVTVEESRTCLEYASRYGMIDTVASIVASGKIPWDDDSYYNAALHAAGIGDIEMILLLFNQLRMDTKSRSGWMDALLGATANGEVKMVDLLIDCYKAMSIKCYTVSSMMMAVSIGCTEIVELFLTKGDANVDASDAHGQTALMLAVEKGQADVVDLLITKYNAKVDAADEIGMTALMYAVYYGHVNLIDLLITNYHANVEVVDSYNRTILILAVEKRRVDVVDLLITKHKVDIEAVDEKGRTALMLAAVIGCPEIMDLLITKGNANVDAANVLGNRALTLAVEKGQIDAIDLLITKYNADLEVTDRHGKTVLMLATRMGSTAIVNLLVTKYNANVEATDAQGRTALIMAAESGLNDIVDILVIKGNANRNATDNQGRTALVIAAAKRHTATVNHLLDKDWDRY